MSGQTEQNTHKGRSAWKPVKRRPAREKTYFTLNTVERWNNDNTNLSISHQTMINHAAKGYIWSNTYLEYKSGRKVHIYEWADVYDYLTRMEKKADKDRRVHLKDKYFSARSKIAEDYLEFWDVE